MAVHIPLIFIPLSFAVSKMVFSGISALMIITANTVLKRRELYEYIC
jgi:hypothetical protein